MLKRVIYSCDLCKEKALEIEVTDGHIPENPVYPGRVRLGNKELWFDLCNDCINRFRQEACNIRDERKLKNGENDT